MYLQFATLHKCFDTILISSALPACGFWSLPNIFVDLFCAFIWGRDCAPVKSALPFHICENLTGQAPVKSALPFHICENLTGQGLRILDFVISEGQRDSGLRPC
jgi:hypothetical protein